MPRTKRTKSESGIYHIMLRGINHQQIFHDSYDYKKFLKVLAECKSKSNFNLFAYCLMGNHVHLLLQETQEPISIIMKRIGSKYVVWYNTKYQRMGHLFQDRYKSEPVESDDYFLSALRYIHCNPVKAGIVNDIAEYQYSSYTSYISGNKLIDSDYIWSIINKKQFESFHRQTDNYEHIEIEETPRFRLTEEQAQIAITEITGCENIEEYQKLDYEIQLKYIVPLKQAGLSIRQISRLTGLAKGIVERR